MMQYRSPNRTKLLPMNIDILHSNYTDVLVSNIDILIYLQNINIFIPNIDILV